MDKKKNHRKPTHIKDYDYSETNAFFITICSKARQELFSRISVGEGLAPHLIELSDYGNIAKVELENIIERFPMVTIEKYVIMPNHIHILLLFEKAGGASPSPTIHDVVCAYKSLVTRSCKNLGAKTTVWQRGYYEHIVRSYSDFLLIRSYIDDNPAKWAEDEYYTP